MYATPPRDLIALLFETQVCAQVELAPEALPELLRRHSQSWTGPMGRCPLWPAPPAADVMMPVFGGFGAAEYGFTLIDQRNPDKIVAYLWIAED